MEQKPPILTVSQLTSAIKMCLETTFPTIYLQGEISNCKLQSSGHLYFSLKDAKAQIAAVMFRGFSGQLARIPKDGDHVMVLGDLNVYPPSGKYQIAVRELKLVGIGELLLKLEELKIKLKERGWFAPSCKKPLPKFPRRIGVVTSPTGAVIQDIINVLTRRFSGFQLLLNPVRVQGEGAAEEIASAIEFFNKHRLADVLIVGRGGGSIEDLFAFNEEVVAKAIFESEIPVISAVGHETDHSIADYVADVRAPTPSAAAEIVTAEKSQSLSTLKQIDLQLQQSCVHLIQTYRHMLEGVKKQPVLSSPYKLLGGWIQKVDDLRANLEASQLRFLEYKKILLDAKKKQLQVLKPTNQMHYFRQKFLQLQQSIDTAIKGKKCRLEEVFARILKQKHPDELFLTGINQRKEKLKNLQEALFLINPKNLLTKGYCILFAEKDRSVITSIHNIKKNQDLRVVLSDGELATTIKEVYPK